MVRGHEELGHLRETGQSRTGRKPDLRWSSDQKGLFHGAPPLAAGAGVESALCLTHSGFCDVGWGGRGGGTGGLNNSEGQGGLPPDHPVHRVRLLPAAPPLGSGFPVPASLRVAALPVPDSVGRAMFSQLLQSKAQNQTSGAGVGPTPFLIQSLWPRDKVP